jgi:hypothetical protein
MVGAPCRLPILLPDEKGRVGVKKDFFHFITKNVLFFTAILLCALPLHSKQDMTSAEMFFATYAFRCKSVFYPDVLHLVAFGDGLHTWNKYFTVGLVLAF